MEDNLKEVSAFNYVCLLSEEKFFPAPDGSYVLEEDMDYLNQLLYSKCIMTLLLVFFLTSIPAVCCLRHQ